MPITWYWMDRVGSGQATACAGPTKLGTVSTCEPTKLGIPWLVTFLLVQTLIGYVYQFLHYNN